jgi:outer membrane protein OmpA-like peptidoglycan-associated protein
MKTREFRNITGPLAVALAAALAAGCATTPRVQPEVIALQNELARVQSDPRIGPYAQQELRDAEFAVRVLSADARGMRPAAFDQSVYLANRLVQIAEAEGLARHATQQGHALDREREQLLVSARAREAQLARADAERARQLADRERMMSHEARQIAERERMLGEEARLQAERERMRGQDALRLAEEERRAAEIARIDAERARGEAAEARRAMSVLQVQLSELQARQTERGLVLTIGDVLFETDRAELKPGAQRQLDTLVTALRENPDFAVAIEGHTDSTGQHAYNMQLSQRRANAVRDYLTSRGVDARRLQSQGLGPDYPVASNQHAAGRQQNRRVEVVIQDPELARLGQYER